MPSGVYIRTKENCDNISKAKKGSLAWNKGLTSTDDSRICSGKTHPFYKRKVSQEMRDRISKTLTGRLGNNLGRKFSKEWCENMSKAKKGVPLSEEHKKNIGDAVRGEKNGFYGRSPSAKTREKMRLAKLIYFPIGWNSDVIYGGKLNKQLKKHIRKRDNNKCRLCDKRKYKKEHSIYHLDSDRYNNNLDNLITLCVHCYSEKINQERSKMLIGHTVSKKTRKKLSKAMSLENHPQWLGGKSFEPYGLKFNRTLRDKIRKRDNYICQLCGSKENGRKHAVHHIDYDKKNNIPENLITLCIENGCHQRTNFNRRHWILYFGKIIKSKRSQK